MQQMTQPNLTNLLTLASTDQMAIQEAILSDIKTESWKTIEAAIFITGTSYVYKRRVSNNPKQFTYKCLSPETLQRAFHLDVLDSGWLLPGIVRHGANTTGNWAVLFVPPTSTTIEIASPQSVLTVALPGFVLLGLHQTYWLWASAEDAFNQSAIAYHAPLPNVYDNGAICWGTYTPPVNSLTNIVSTWEKFISTPFANHLVSGKSRSHSNDICQKLLALNEASGTNTTYYPTDDLIPIGRSSAIADLIDETLHSKK
jgi:hypothetical protein